MTEYTPETIVRVRIEGNTTKWVLPISSVAKVWAIDPWEICWALEEEGRCDLDPTSHIQAGDD